jgi:hypothetical protein
VLALHNLSRATCLHVAPLNHSHVKLLDKACKPQSVTPALDCLVTGECVFDDMMILFDFRFGKSAGLEKFLFHQKYF